MGHGWVDRTCLLTHTQLHPTSPQFPDSAPPQKHSLQSNPVVDAAVSSKPTVSQQEHRTGSEIKADLEVSKV